ncbi:beta strand repeat-containing protein [Sphingopyxis yananensis]|uniref:beta strand repeat-containing protein n=1 Tax=Sphingopyxis yananensis TaxID=2886687 RepID=UPI001D12A897|nr:hypothetical protein [Sphingopyxis yananensis]MCC2602458.1 hypothetical protein [Sphingopyxis yananensis]
MTSLSPARFTTLKSMLNGGCAALTCAVMLGFSAPASAQITGNYHSGMGGVTLDSTVNTGQVTVDQGQTVIRWTPTGPNSGAYVTFLEAGNSLNFNASSAVNGNYTVLNQFVNADGSDFASAINFNGNVTSSPNGNIWFQNGAGIYVGQTGRFDVGALVLTSRNILHDLQDAGSAGTSGSLYGANGEIQFGGTRTSTDFYDGIVWNSGTINATSNYVAIVAPNIVHDGTVTAHGSVAYVVAEAASIRINQGLFDIDVTTGSGTGTGNETLLTHRGQTLVNGSDPNQNIYMVAIPKNNAVTMLVQGNVGYSADTATTGSNGSIILSAGRNIVGGQIDISGPVQANADIRIQTAASSTTSFNGAVTAHASGRLTGDISTASTLAFANSSNLTGDASVDVFVSGRLEMGHSGSLDPADLSLTSSGTGASSGDVRLSATGGVIQLDGNLNMNADSSLVLGTDFIRGGAVTLSASGGGQLLSGADTQVTLSANGFDSSGSSQPFTIYGGQVRVGVESGGSLDLNNISVDASGDDYAGRISFIANGGTIAADSIDAAADGLNGSGQDPSDPTPVNTLTATDGIIFQAVSGGRIAVAGGIDAATSASMGFHLSGAADNMISAQNGISADAGGWIELHHTGRGAGTNSISGGAVNFSARNKIVADANSKIMATEALDLRGGRGIDLGEAQSQGTTSLYAEDGTVLVDNLLSSDTVDVTGRSVDIASTAGLSFSNINAFSGDATIRVANTLGIMGSAQAEGNITLTSADIDIDSSSGQIMSFSPDSTVRLINGNSANTTKIGGTQTGNEYHLSSDELNSIRADTIIIEAPASAASSAPQVILDDMTVDFGDIGNLSILSGGDMSVVGNVNVFATSDIVRLNLVAAREMRILLGEGSIFMGNMSGSSEPTGTLNLTAPRIIAATQSAINDLASATTQRQYEQRLMENDGFANNGYIAAGRINATVDTGFFVQNSGDGILPTERNGLAFGPGGLNINTSNANTLVVINGTRQTFNGIFTGADAITPFSDIFPGVTINGERPSSSTSFNQISLMNSCLIVDPTVCGAAALGPDTPTTPNLPEFPIQVIIGDPTSPDNEPEDEVIAEERESAEMPESLISVSDIHPMSGEPLIIDPVTGAANDDLWAPTP